MEGELHKAIGVLKKRMSDFEQSLRELEITRYGLKVGKPLRGLRGILTGTPQLVDNQITGNGLRYARSLRQNRPPRSDDLPE
jgi:circadian clock protein KaiC